MNEPAKEWRDILRTAEIIRRFYIEELISLEDQRELGETKQRMIEQFKGRSDRLNYWINHVGDQQIEDLVRQKFGNARIQNLHIPQWSTIFAILRWLWIDIEEFSLSQQARPQEIIQLIQSRFLANKMKPIFFESSLENENSTCQYKQVKYHPSKKEEEYQMRETPEEQSQVSEAQKPLNQIQIFLNRGDEHTRLPSIGEDKYKKNFLEQVRQRLKQPYNKFIEQFIQTCQTKINFGGFNIQLFGIHLSNLLKSGSKDFIRKFITVNPQNYCISIGRYQYFIDQNFIDEMMSSSHQQIECQDIWFEIIRQYLSTETFKKSKQKDFLYQLNNQICNNYFQLIELSTEVENIEHLIEDLLPMLERRARGKNIKIHKIIRCYDDVFCCNSIIGNRYQITTYDNYKTKWLSSQQLSYQISQASSESSVKLFLIGVGPKQDRMVQQILKEIQQSCRKGDFRYAYQMKKQKQKKSFMKIQFPQDRNQKIINDITFLSFWKKVVDLNLYDIANLFQIKQRGIHHSEEVICVLASIYNHFLKNKPTLVAQCFRVDKETATLTFHTNNGTKNAKEQYYFQHFFNLYGYQILLREGLSQSIIRKSFQQMYQKMIIHCLQQNLTLYATGYLVPDVLRLFIREYHHTRIYFTLSQSFIAKTNNKITYRQITSRLVDCFNRYGGHFKQNCMLKHFDGHCCRLIGQNTQIRPENSDKKQTELLKSQLCNYTEQMSISYIQLRSKQEAHTVYSQILTDLQYFSRQIKEQFGVQLEIHDQFLKNFQKISINPKLLS